MKLPIFVVDAFASGPFTGNPAGVCPLLNGESLSDSMMQSIAMEMNHAETAFVVPEGDRGYRLRWFTPEIEVDLCGHATLATAHVLTRELGVTANQLRFQTRTGDLTASPRGESIVLDFPALPARPEALAAPLTFLPSAPRWTGRAGDDWIVQLDEEEEVRNLKIAPAEVAALGNRGLIVTAAGTDVDFVSRCFYPAVGIVEDPVTGSAHCALGPFWADRLAKMDLIGYQASRRGGTVGVEVRGSRVGLIGEARTILRGTLDV